MSTIVADDEDAPPSYELATLPSPNVEDDGRQLDNANVSAWSVEDVQIYFARHHNHIAPAFFGTQRVTGGWLLAMTESQLQEMGLKESEYVPIMVHVKRLKNAQVVVSEQPRSSAPAAARPNDGIRVDDIVGPWMCFCLPVFCSIYSKTKGEDDDTVVHSGCCFIGPIPCQSFREERKRVSGHPNAFCKVGEDKNIDWYTSTSFAHNCPLGCSFKTNCCA